MNENLKVKIEKYLDDSASSVKAFERKARLNNNVVYSILTNKSKNPNMETVLKIADALNCSLDELFERKNFLTKYSNDELFKIKLNTPLFKSICVYVSDYLDKGQLTDLNLGQAIDFIEEIYKYCLDKQSNQIDKHFAEWFLKNNLLK
jgi:transcriptional regulator with XRE-family HTH domain